jgi:hypothetical protein
MIITARLPTTCMRYGFENSFNFKRDNSHSAYTDRWQQVLMER